MLSVTVEELLVTVSSPGLLRKQSHSLWVPTSVPSDSGPPPKVTLKLLVFAVPQECSSSAGPESGLWPGQLSLCVFKWQMAGPVSCGLLLPGPLYIGLLTLAGSLPPHNEWAIS